MARGPGFLNQIFSRPARPHSFNTVNPRIGARDAYFKFGRRRGAQSRGGGKGTYFIFPKSWPDMITFLVYHLRVNNIKSCLST